MLNDAFLIRQCEHIAKRLVAESPTPELQIDAAFRLILLRKPDGKEFRHFVDYAQRHGLANAVQILLNGNEFMYVD
jgi:hypothetical protein